MEANIYRLYPSHQYFVLENESIELIRKKKL